MADVRGSAWSSAGSTRVAGGPGLVLRSSQGPYAQGVAGLGDGVPGAVAQCPRRTGHRVGVGDLACQAHPGQVDEPVPALPVLLVALAGAEEAGPLVEEASLVVPEGLG